MKAHLLIFDGDSVTLKSMIEVVDDMPEIENWHVVFENTICVASDLNAKALAGRFNPLLPDIRYLISEVRPDRKGGCMRKSILTLMNSPGPAQHEPA